MTSRQTSPHVSSPSAYQAAGAAVRRPGPTCDGTAERMTVGLAVTWLRQQLGLSQGELAGLASVDQSYLSCIERGRKNASLPVARRLAAALGVTLDVLHTLRIAEADLAPATAGRPAVLPYGERNPRHAHQGVA